jgi:hypothetical protein
MKNLLKLGTLGLVAGLAALPALSLADGWHRDHFRPIIERPLVSFTVAAPICTPVYVAPCDETVVVDAPVFRYRTERRIEYRPIREFRRR